MIINLLLGFKMRMLMIQMPNKSQSKLKLIAEMCKNSFFARKMHFCLFFDLQARIWQVFYAECLRAEGFLTRLFITLLVAAGAILQNKDTKNPGA